MGKDCRRAKGHDELRTALEAEGHLNLVGCQKICEGPVAGACVDGHLEWFARLRKGRHRRALARLVRRGGRRVPEELRDRRERRRRDRLRS